MSESDLRRIVLRRGPDVWQATFEHDAEVLAAFGSDTLPTPYRSVMQAREVRDLIAARNPQALVMVEASAREGVEEQDRAY